MHYYNIRETGPEKHSPPAILKSLEISFSAKFEDILQKKYIFIVKNLYKSIYKLEFTVSKFQELEKTV